MVSCTLFVVLLFAVGINACCIVPDVKEDFDRKLYVGTWHVQNVYGPPLEGAGQCMAENLSIEDGKAKGSVTWVEKSDCKNVKRELPLKELKKTCCDKEAMSLLQIGEKKAKLYVLDTDYKTYAITYRCTDDQGTVGIMTRNQKRDDCLIEKLEEKAKKLIDLPSPLKKIDQCDCEC